MHVLFIPYGRKEWLDIFLRDMMAQKHFIKHTSPEGKEENVICTASLRILPGGVYDYVFPKESMDIVLTTLRFHVPCDYPIEKEFSFMGIKIKPLDYAKKFLGLEEKLPEFKTTQQYFWEGSQFVAILPIGIKFDDDIINPASAQLPGYKHEGL